MAYNLNLHTLRGKINNIKALIVDASLTIVGAAADAKAVGDAFIQQEQTFNEMQDTVLSPHLENTSNPHRVTKSQLGLANVDNTSDEDKPVSTAQAEAIAAAKQEGLNAANDAKQAGLNAANDAMEEAKKKATPEYVNGRITSQMVMLSSSAWKENCQTVEVKDVTADVSKTDVLVSCDPADDNWEAYTENGIRVYAQGDGNVQFKCETPPPVDVSVNVMVRRAE